MTCINVFRPALFCVYEVCANKSIRKLGNGRLLRGVADDGMEMHGSEYSKRW